MADQSPVAKPSVVYTDGACRGNPGPGGWAWAESRNDYASGFAEQTTNQRMEIQAAFEAAQAIDGPLEVVSDSTYVVNCFRQRWWAGWLKRGWVNAQGKPVANRDLWEPFVDLVRRRGDVSFRWVKGHGGDALNEFADQLAVEAALTGRGKTSGKGAKKRKGRAARKGSAKTAAAPKGARGAKAGTAGDETRVRTSGAPELQLAGPFVYLVVGDRGVGKTTYAKKLAAKKKALRFSIEEWIPTLFARERNDAGSDRQLEERRRCEEQIWSVCRQVLSLGGDVVLDLGFKTLEQRERFRKLTARENATAQIHFLDVPAVAGRDQRGRRHTKREPALPNGTGDDEFEPPSKRELRDGVRVGG